MLRRWWLVLGLMVSASAGAVDPNELLPSALAFQVEAVRARGDQAYVTFTIAPGYALYRDRVAITSDQGPLRSLSLPRGSVVHDAYLGDREEWRYRAIATIRLRHGTPLTHLTVRLQGCADLGVCFNPEIRSIDVK